MKLVLLIRQSSLRISNISMITLQRNGVFAISTERKPKFGRNVKILISAFIIVIALVTFSLIAAGTFAPNLSGDSIGIIVPDSSKTETSNSTETTTAGTAPKPIEPITFTCWADSDYKFNVSVKVNLNDGMNSTEAETVACAIFEHELNASYVVRSATTDHTGIWKVNMGWEYDVPAGKIESLTHFFNVKIDPKNLTVTYTRCY